MMKAIYRIIAVLFTLAVMAACGDNITPTPDNGGEDNPTEQPDEKPDEKPSFVVTLSADRVVLFADRDEKTVFSVKKSDADATSSAKIYMTQVTDGNATEGKPLSKLEFAATEPGVYAFVAVVEDVVSEPLTVKVVSAQEYQSAYDRHIAGADFTGAWCTFCYDGNNNINRVVEINPTYKRIVHLMAFHSDSQGDDIMAIDETEVIYDDFSLNGYPSFLTDFRTSGGLTNGGDFKNSLEESLADWPAHCGVAVSSEVNEGVATVTASIRSELTLPYRVAVFVVEDKIVYHQKTGSLGTIEEYTHRHVVRKVVTSSYKGERMDEATDIIAEGQEKTKTFEFTVNSDWNLENTEIYVLAMDYNGYVNNVNVCGIDGGSADYNMFVEE